jgi:hypothetical protein
MLKGIYEKFLRRPQKLSNSRMSNFIVKKLDEDQFLSPTVQTKAIEELSQKMVNYFNKEPGAFDKPTCVVCFDMSGTGKTTTIKEAARNSKSLIAHISLIENRLFTPLLNSCQNMYSKQVPPLEVTDEIPYAKVQSYFKERFQSVLSQLFQSIIEAIGEMDPSKSDSESNIIKVSIPKYATPSSTPTEPKPKLPKTPYENVLEIVKAKNQLLVIHLDDCQVNSSYS